MTNPYGRPKLPPELRKTKNITVRFTEKELKRLEVMRKVLKQDTISKAIRSAVHDYCALLIVMPDEDEEHGD